MSEKDLEYYLNLDWTLIEGEDLDLEGNPSSDVRYNPNNSYDAIEGITSPDGRIFGKMAHCERSGHGLYQNVTGNKMQDIFSGAVRYFQ